MKNIVDLFIRDLKRRAYSSLTIREYKREIKRFKKFIDKKGRKFNEVDHNIVEEFLYSLNTGPFAVNRSISALKKFYGFLENRKIILENPMKNVGFSRVDEKNPVFLSEKEFKILKEGLRLCEDDGFFEIRNKMMLRILLATGLRVSELVNLRVQDVHFDELGAVLEVSRKGNKMDLVYLGKENAEILKNYVKIRMERKVNSNYLFVSKSGKKMDRTMVYRIVKDFFKSLGLEKRKMGPHVLRHTFATILMKKNVSIYKIKELMNHKRITTTEKYLHLVEEDLRKTLEEVGL